MLLLNPRMVRFGGEVWTDVTVLAIDRVGTRVIAEWGDQGPHPVFADVPERKTVVRIVQEVGAGGLRAPALGDEQELTARTTPAGSDGEAYELRARCVVTGVAHELSVRRGALRTIELIAVSAAGGGGGGTDPVSVVRVNP